MVLKMQLLMTFVSLFLVCESTSKYSPEKVNMQLEDLALTIKEIFPDLDSSLIVKIVGETNDPETAFSKAEDADVQLKYGGVQIDDWVMEDVKVQHKYGEDEEWNFDWRDDQLRWFHDLSTEEKHEVVNIVNENTSPAQKLRRTFNCSTSEARNFIYYWKYKIKHKFEITEENWTNKLHTALNNEDKDSVKVLLNYFGKDENDKLIENMMKEDESKNTALHLASYTDNEEIVKLLLNVFDKEENQKLIEFVTKENKSKNTALHITSRSGVVEIIKLLLNAFPEDENTKKIAYVMNENKDKETALHYASESGMVEIIKLLLNSFPEDENKKKIEYVMKENSDAKDAIRLAGRNTDETVLVETIQLLASVFGKDEKEDLMEIVMQENGNSETTLHYYSELGYLKMIKLLFSAFIPNENRRLIEFVMKETYTANTALHLVARDTDNEPSLNLETVELLLSVFGENEKEKLIEFVMKKNEDSKTALNLAKHGEIKTLLSQKVINAENEIILCDLRQVAKKTQEEKNLWSLLEGNLRNSILQFLVTITEDESVNKSLKIEKNRKE